MTRAPQLLKIGGLALLASLTACASVATRLPEISIPALKAEQVSQEKLAFAEMERLHARLHDVAYPVLSANTALCPKTRRDIGVTTHTLKSYPKEMRAAAARELGALDSAKIRRVMKGSPAENAGLKIGDAIMSWDGKALAAGSKTYLALLAEPETTLTVLRGKTELRLPIRPIEICDYKVSLSMRSTVNAYATGSRLTLTSGMMNFTQSDDELALIVAHELAHNTMGHVRKIVGNMIVSGMATRYTRPFESEADYVGLYFLTRAGYSPEGIEDVWKRMALIGPRSVARAKTHPTYPDRFLRLSAARDEIRAKQAAGQPLVPNFIGKDSGPE